MQKNYWLFKAEPHIYGIEQLNAAPQKIGRWDGIRNYQARNFLRDQIALHDDVFIYHSGCKNLGIVGTAKIVRTAYPDPTQFDPESPYYDPKSSRENPRWVSVDLQLTHTFARLISLNEIKQQPALHDDVFIYHSGCKNLGIVGTAKIVRTAYPDPTQFDPENSYYDPKSSSGNPRWVSVDIQLTHTFARLISLNEIKQQPALENMVLIKQSRLSTQPVTKAEWEFIMAMV